METHVRLSGCNTNLSSEDEENKQTPPHNFFLVVSFFFFFVDHRVQIVKIHFMWSQTLFSLSLLSIKVKFEEKPASVFANYRTSVFFNVF